MKRSLIPGVSSEVVIVATRRTSSCSAVMRALWFLCMLRLSSARVLVSTRGVCGGRGRRTAVDDRVVERQPRDAVDVLRTVNTRGVIPRENGGFLGQRAHVGVVGGVERRQFVRGDERCEVRVEDVGDLGERLDGPR